MSAEQLATRVIAEHLAEPGGIETWNRNFARNPGGERRRIEQSGARDPAFARQQTPWVFQHVRVPVANLIGEVNAGWTYITGALDLMQRHPDDAARRERMIDAAVSVTTVE